MRIGGPNPQGESPGDRKAKPGGQPIQHDPRRPAEANLTPGVIDGYAKRAFKVGACGALAIALHDATGWPIVAITDAHNVFEDGRAGGGSALHWTVRRPDGKLIDIDGAHDQADLVAEYMGEADGGEAAAGLSTRADAVEWYIECQGEPIRVSLAATFVQAVLEGAGCAHAGEATSEPMSVETYEARREAIRERFAKRIQSANSLNQSDGHLRDLQWELDRLDREFAARFRA